MNIQESVNEVIKDPSKLSEKLKDLKQGDLLFDTLSESVTKTIKAAYLEKYVKDLLEEKDTKTKPKNLELFKKMQDLSINHFGDITEESLSTGIASYLSNGGEFDEVEIPEIQVLFKESYLLEDSDELANTEAKYTTKQRDNMQPSSFCGPGKSFPVTNRSHVVAARRLIGRYKGGDKASIMACVNRKAKAMGMGSKEGKNENEVFAVFYPITIESRTETDVDYLTPLSINSKEELQSIIDNKVEICKTYSLSEEQVTKLDEFLKEITENIEFCTNSDPLLQYKESNATPVTLGPEFLAQYFTQRESDQKDYLTALVGLVRTKKITETEIKEAASKYQCFGSATLKVLLAKGFTESVPAVPIQQTPGPVEAQEKDDTSIFTDEKTEISTELLEDFFKGKTKKVLKTNSKEKN